MQGFPYLPMWSYLFEMGLFIRGMCPVHMGLSPLNLISNEKQNITSCNSCLQSQPFILNVSLQILILDLQKLSHISFLLFDHLCSL